MNTQLDVDTISECKMGIFDRNEFGSIVSSKMNG